MDVYFSESAPNRLRSTIYMLCAVGSRTHDVTYYVDLSREKTLGQIPCLFKDNLPSRGTKHCDCYIIKLDNSQNFDSQTSLGTSYC